MPDHTENKLEEVRRKLDAAIKAMDTRRILKLSLQSHALQRIIAAQSLIDREDTK